ncbi:MAG: hypothetical protein COV57_01765 [Candidatus Liptonbacteria bacterium CG11_big_fil_rev_8_21_14_0_20_35_14]|uniref:Hsp70 family protein n=1 Tax=Candidatus Liptonbacteria bacterium CG11_big_fil_rev_8_21_14_0_20_35_14 TaxID=1974634 RepID=A0A2H0N9Y4_9BACT|nr:MAG: hypothetical protein COV57_01765 [Candidatus Liptonbacteria bacterium CG11_big_fil_rev_8_21_14_0_20_35_14]
MNDSIYCGLDFGTSNSAISVINESGVFLNENYIMPSLIFFPKTGGIFIGNEAIEKCINEKYKGRLIQSFKNFLSDPLFDKTRIGDYHFSLEDLISIIMKDLKENMECFLDKEIDSVVLGRPAQFSDDAERDLIAEERLINSAKLSGFKKIAIQIEPIAAALDYEFNLESEELVLVGDFGGGTSDFTIMKLSKENIKKKDRKEDIIGTSGINIAGDFFNSSIMWEKIAKHFGLGAKYESTSGKVMDVPTALLWHLREWHKLPFLDNPQDKGLINRLLMTCNNKDAIVRFKQVIDNQLGFGLFQSIDKAKCNLSQEDNSKILFTSDFFSIEERIKSNELDLIIEDELADIDEAISNLLKSVSLSNENIDSVFLTGGSSHLTQIQEIFKKRFGFNKIKRQGSGFVNVSNGLALSSLYLDFKK